jgi:hypothetical protein
MIWATDRSGSLSSVTEPPLLIERLLRNPGLICGPSSGRPATAVLKLDLALRADRAAAATNELLAGTAIRLWLICGPSSGRPATAVLKLDLALRAIRRRLGRRYETSPKAETPEKARSKRY